MTLQSTHQLFQLFLQTFKLQKHTQKQHYDYNIWKFKNETSLVIPYIQHVKFQILENVSFGVSFL